MNEKLALLFAQLDVARMRYARTRDEADDRALAAVQDAITAVASQQPAPEWNQREKTRFEWDEDGCMRLSSREFGQIDLILYEVATAHGVAPKWVYLEAVHITTDDDARLSLPETAAALRDALKALDTLIDVTIGDE